MKTPEVNKSLASPVKDGFLEPSIQGFRDPRTPDEVELSSSRYAPLWEWNSSGEHLLGTRGNRFSRSRAGKHGIGSLSSIE
jgi:hypothetical protein